MQLYLINDISHPIYSSVAEYFDFAQQPRSQSMTVGSIAKKMVIPKFKMLIYKHLPLISFHQQYLSYEV